MDISRAIRSRIGIVKIKAAQAAFLTNEID